MNIDECRVVVHELSTIFVWRRYTKPYCKIKTPWWQWWCPSMIMSELMVWLLSLRQPFVVWSRHCLERYDYLACFFKFTFRNYCLYNEKTVSEDIKALISEKNVCLDDIDVLTFSDIAVVEVWCCLLYEIKSLHIGLL